MKSLFRSALFIFCALIMQLWFGTLVYCSDPSDIYLLQVESGSVTIKIAGEERSLRRMEIIPENSRLTVTPDATAYLTCPGCKVFKWTKEKNGDPVTRTLLDSNRSKMSILKDNFVSALKSFVYPDSVPGEIVFMVSRGDESENCKGLLPYNSEKILYLGKSLPFRWNGKESSSDVEVKNTFTEEVLFSQEVEGGSCRIPLNDFEPGYAYQWSVISKRTDETCRTVFTIMTEEQSAIVKATMDQIVQLLPPGTDDDTKLRLQAGYLISADFYTDAFRLLESKDL